MENNQDSESAPQKSNFNYERLTRIFVDLIKTFLMLEQLTHLRNQSWDTSNIFQD